MPRRGSLFIWKAVSELLRLAGDPDWRRCAQSSQAFSKGVPLGVDVRLPRAPALFHRKHKQRTYSGADRGFDDCVREYYPLAREHDEQVGKQFRREVEVGCMVKYELEQAQREFGSSISVASIGAIPKPDSSVRVIHDATNGLRLNDCIRVRDAQSCPTGADPRVALEQLP